jgi:hypothetical protein
VRVRAAHGDRDRAEEWLLIEWPVGAAEPLHYWLSTLPETVSFKPDFDSCAYIFTCL